MTISRVLWAALPLLAMSACASHHRDRERPAQATAGWRAIATPADRDRVRTWRDAWTQALARVTSPADRARVTGEGALFQPDAALPGPIPPPGDYRCRVTKLGGRGDGGMRYVAYPAFACRITREADVLSLAKLGGSQRPVGLLFPDDGGRLVFLGSMTLGDEKRPLDYGRDPERDMAGLFERVGADRWRLVLPFPRWESTLDVMELVPAG
ncbi:DUF4893 domain-containing protein [Sphingomonas solaris]|uniref:DUF4893 domain-containing protein n=1 Tax=Alterirhizorhabdus solaris TaxID=2529389 RepID=A0A558QZR3_9SPHN|nr:DUF4893 domain-containing protein [Sphingomonas solaris]TVV72562.1 DUF4893 domain-containing protein [Sphingomonas solaris]